MCMICVDYQNGKLTFEEAVRNLQEMLTSLDSEHIDYIIDMLFNPEKK